MQAFCAAAATRLARDGSMTARVSARRCRAQVAMIRGFPNNLPGGEGGGSNGRGDGRDVFGELVSFPTVWCWKCVGVRQGDFMNDIVDSVADALATDRKNVKTSFRDKGKYRSITLRAPVNTSAQIYSVYAAISRDPRVKFKF